MSTTASPANIPPVKMDKLAAKAEKEAAKAEKERIKAEKEAAKAEKERIKAEKLAEKERIKAEKEAAKAEKEAAKAEKERLKADSKTNMVQTLPAKEHGDLTTLSDKVNSENDYSLTISHLKHDVAHSFQDIMRGFDFSNHYTIDKKFHKFAALIFYIRFLLINSNTSFDIQAFDSICNPFSFDFISFIDFIPYFIQSTLIQYSQYSIDCKL